MTAKPTIAWPVGTRLEERLAAVSKIVKNERTIAGNLAPNPDGLRPSRDTAHPGFGTSVARWPIRIAQSRTTPSRRAGLLIPFASSTAASMKRP